MGKCQGFTDKGQTIIGKESRKLHRHRGAKIKFVGEAFNVVGDVEEGKSSGGAQKIHGRVISWGLLQRECNLRYQTLSNMLWFYENDSILNARFFGIYKENRHI